MGGIFSNIANRTGPGLALQELLYGYIMAMLFITAARFNLLKITDAMDLAVLMVGMDFTWGMIDCILFYAIDVSDQKRMLKDLTSDVSLEEKAERIDGDFDCSPLDLIEEESRRRICREVAASPLENHESMRKDRRRMLTSAFYCFIATVTPLLPAVLPLFLIDDLDFAMLTSSLVSSAMIFIVGWRFGSYIGIKGWQSAAITSGIAFSITLIATFTGG
ncbi:MAG: hypothetical protein IKP20_00920 [Candidatus Methanomethylophilaceae archaeon]|nr:hypothetical protein [Candidatus Methanomethylophilaceae archaeon]